MQIDQTLFRDHLTRVKASVQNSYSLADIPKWICENTYIKGENYSFKGHEFQERIISSTAPEVNVMKCSQIGLSEIMARWVMAVAYNFPSFSTIITFPFSGDSADFARTRVDPFIASSPLLKAAMNSKLDNSEIKQVLESLVYFRGTNGTTAAISIPADCIVSDEVDRSNPHILTQYTSRLTHSIYKWRRNFSTPTVKGYGIDLMMQTSRRFKNLCKCSHCNHYFVPDFFEHVKIPGFDNELRSINKNTLPKTRYLEAKLLCPACHEEPDLYPDYREYVQENLDDQFEAEGIFVSPFDAPSIINPVGLLRAMVSYARLSEFINQNLGQTSEEVSESLVLGDIVDCTKITELMSTSIHAMGCDMGLICHIVIGRLTLEGQFLIVHREKVVLGLFEQRRRELKAKYHVGITVCDSQPYVDLIQRMQKYDKNLFGAVYIETKALEIFKIKMFEGDAAEGKLPIHTIQINRNKALDELLGKFKGTIEGTDEATRVREVVIQEMDPDLEDEYQKHLLDMKRVQVFDNNQELTYVWQKSNSAIDHFHHATMYLYAACKARGTITRDVPMAGGPLIRRFKVQPAAQK